MALFAVVLPSDAVSKTFLDYGTLSGARGNECHDDRNDETMRQRLKRMFVAGIIFLDGRVNFGKM